MTHAPIPKDDDDDDDTRQRFGLTGGLIRRSVGIEAAAGLVDDLFVALDAV